MIKYIKMNFSHPEVLDFCKKKIANLEKKAGFLSELSAEKKAEIRLVTEGIRELQQLALDPKSAKKRIFNF
jgi:hypothetical protein